MDTPSLNFDKFILAYLHDRLYKQEKFFLGAKAFFNSSPKDCGGISFVEKKAHKKGL
jgi:hypothetical protein